MAFDGRSREISWNEETQFVVGYHYNMAIEQAINCEKLLDAYILNGDFTTNKQKTFPDCRNKTIVDPLTEPK